MDVLFVFKLFKNTSGFSFLTIYKPQKGCFYKFMHLNILVKHDLNLNVKLANNWLQNEIVKYNALKYMHLT